MPSTGAEVLTKRAQAERAYAQLSATGVPVSAGQLAAAAGLSASYARALLAEFHAQPAAALRTTAAALSRRTRTPRPDHDRICAGRPRRCQPPVAALEHAWSAIRSHHPDVPRVVVVVASGSDPRSRRLNLGHFAAGRWQLASAMPLRTGRRC